MVREVADKFLVCGVLAHGFARVLCDACAHEYLLAFSCKARYFCPSCQAKRLALWTLWLEESSLPPCRSPSARRAGAGPGSVGRWLRSIRCAAPSAAMRCGSSAVVGIGSPSFPVNATDAMYEKYPIGAEWKVTDPATGKPAMRNIFLDGNGTADERENSVRAPQRRGVIFWQCNNALKRVATQIANAVKRPQPEVYADLRASGLNPGVILVPAHTMLIGLSRSGAARTRKSEARLNPRAASTWWSTGARIAFLRIAGTRALIGCGARGLVFRYDSLFPIPDSRP